MTNQQAITGPKQCYGKVFIEILADPALSAHAKLCYAVMTSFGANATTWASVGTISIRMSSSENTVRKAQKELEDSGWIIRGSEIPGATIHWRMIAPFERTPSRHEGVHHVKGGASPHEGEGFTTRGGGVRLVNPKQELKQELDQEISHTKKAPEVIPPEVLKKAPGKKTDQDPKTPLLILAGTDLGKAFKKAYDQCGIGTYYFNNQDLAAQEQARNLGLTDAQLEAALKAFFAPDSWHRKNGYDRFANFIKQASSYARRATADMTASQEDLSRYYEPWDPRHPQYVAKDPIITRQKELFEQVHGPWKPKPDYDSSRKP